MPPKKAAGSASKKSTTSKPTANGVIKSKATKKAPAKSATKTEAKGPAKRASKTTAQAAPKAPAKTTSKAAPKPTAANTVAANTSKKRKAADDEQEEAPKVNGVKRARTATESATPAPAATKRKAAAKKAPAKAKIVLNTAPTRRLDIYVFGNGEQCELGIGPDPATTREVKRPRLHPFLNADKVGVVAFSVGGMHTAVLTHDNKIMTWGVNDQGALGRNTEWEGGERDISDDKSDSDSEEEEKREPLNPYESTPGEVDVSALPSDIVWTQLACTDSATFALTDEGLVYGWGTFRGNDGIFGFRQVKPRPDGKVSEIVEELIERRPILVERLKDVTQIAAGSNHVLALTSKGEVLAWGAGQQNQLGRRIKERHLVNGLVPTAFGLRKDIVLVGAGAYHSFAVHKNGTVYSWGLSGVAQTGIAEDAGDGKLVESHLLAVVKSFNKFGKVICIDGGLHHSVAVTDKGELLVWGRLDGSQLGLDIASLPKADIQLNFSSNKPEGLKVPTPIPGIDAHQAAAGSDHCVAVAKDGKAYSWGFSVNYQTGLNTIDEVKIATHIDNTAVRGKQLVEAGCGGQFSVLAGLAGVNHLVNGA